MKIAIIGAAVSIHTVKFVNSFVELGHDVTLFSLTCHREGENIIDRRVRIIYLQGSSALSYYLKANELRRELEEGCFDVVNAHYASGYGTLARWAKAKSLVLSVWGSDVYDVPHKNPMNFHIVKKNLEYARLILSTSMIMAREVEKFFPGQKKEIAVIPFGVNLSLFTKRKDTALSNDLIRIGMVKSLKRVYAIDNLIRAVADLIERTSRTVELIICGDGAERSSLEQLVKELNIGTHVIWKGAVPNNKIPEILQQIHIFVQSSVRESFGVAAVEAMAMELPVVATDVEGFREVVDNGKTGFLVPINCPQEMSDALLTLVEDPKLREEMGKCGRQKVERLYNFDYNVKQMLAAYEKVRDEK